MDKIYLMTPEYKIYPCLFLIVKSKILLLDAFLIE
jgi:hypothetical protein